MDFYLFVYLLKYLFIYFFNYLFDLCSFWGGGMLVGVVVVAPPSTEASKHGAKEDYLLMDSLRNCLSFLFFSFLFFSCLCAA